MNERIVAFRRNNGARLDEADEFAYRAVRASAG